MIRQCLAYTQIPKDLIISVIGDSTGNEVAEWVYLWASALASEYAATHRVEYSLYDAATGQFPVPTVLTAGPSGELCANTGGAVFGFIPQQSALAIPAGSDLDVRAKIAPADWTPAARQGIASHWIGTTQRSWALLLNTNGTLALWYSGDGSAQTFVNSTASTGFTDGDTRWVRATLDIDNGASGTTVTFFTSTDGTTWTQLGNTVTTAGALAGLFQSTGDIYLGARTGEALVGKVFHVEARVGANGKQILPPGLSDWQYPTGISMGGSPTIKILNASVSGYNIANFLTAANIDNAIRRIGHGMILVSLGHNQGSDSGFAFTTATGGANGSVTEMITAIRARTQVPLIWIAQNPQTNAATRPVSHAIRLTQLTAYLRSQGIGTIDVFSPFAETPNWQTALMADTVHPNAAGQAVWLAAVREALI